VDTQQGGCATLHDRHIALIVPVAITLMAFGAAVVSVPITPRQVACEVTLYDSQYEQHVVIGKGEVL
jgi:siroheme synthase